MSERPERRETAHVAESTREGSDSTRIGLVVFVVLMALVLLEYVVAILMDKNLVVMVVMNVIDAAIIMYYFMHVTRLWRSGREES